MASSDGPRAIVVGASSGIGRELAKLLARRGYRVGVTGRREALLATLRDELGEACIPAVSDVTSPTAMDEMRALIAELGGLDLAVISAGTGHLNGELCHELEVDTNRVNVDGFAAMVNVFMHHFVAQGDGHLVNIASIAALRGNGGCPAYFASKAYQSNYLDGMRHKAAQLGLPIATTDVLPGPLLTAMQKTDSDVELRESFWIASAAKAADRIDRAILHRRRRAYIPGRSRLIAWGLRLAPNWLYDRFG